MAKRLFGLFGAAAGLVVGLFGSPVVTLALWTVGAYLGVAMPPDVGEMVVAASDLACAAAGAVAGWRIGVRLARPSTRSAIEAAPRAVAPQTLRVQ